MVPRLGMVFDLTGAGRTVLKANWGRYAWNPGAALAENVNDNPADWYRRYAGPTPTVTASTTAAKKA